MSSAPFGSEIFAPEFPPLREHLRRCGAMWMRVLEARDSRTRQSTIFNMLEYMGAWQWYDCQVKLVQSTVYTRRKKLVDHKGAATYVLDNMYIYRKSIGVTVGEASSTYLERIAKPALLDGPESLKEIIFACSLAEVVN